MTLEAAELERMVRATIERLVQLEEDLAAATHRIGDLEAEQLKHNARILELEGREAPVDLERRLITLEGQLAAALRRQKGDPGERGPRGFQGERGRAGADGKHSDTVIREVKISG